MNFIVSGDQHIKISKELPLEWQLNRFRLLWQNYVDLCEEHNAELILVGDLAHSANTNKYENMLMQELFCLLDKHEINTHIIAGNHENMGAIGTTLDFMPMLKSLDWVHYHPVIAFRNLDSKTELVYVGHNRLQEWLDSGDTEWQGTRIVFSHFRPTINQFIQEEIDVQKFLSTGDYFFLGDIHSNCDFAPNAIFTNAPLNNHFEPNPQCGVLLVTLTNGEVSHQRLPLTLPNLVQIDTTAETFEDTLDPYNFYRVSVTGTPEALRKLRTESTTTKLLKIPDIVDTYTELEVTEEVCNQSLLEALILYMQELGMQETEILRMTEVWCEP